MRCGSRTFYSSLLLTAGVLIVTLSPQRAFAAADPAKLAAEAGYLTQNTAAMNKMMTDMAIEPSGDVDHDFVAVMQPHHQGAIDMAQGELAFGSNEQLTRIAQGIIVEQLQEIAAMRLAIGETASPSWVVDTKPQADAKPGSNATRTAEEARFLARTTTAMNTMMANMAIPPTGNVDHDFVAMMVPHHQGAIEMAQFELRYGENAQLKQVAQEIIVDQIQEIAMMRLALGEPLPPSVSSPTQNVQPSPNAPIQISRGMQMAGAMNMNAPAGVSGE